MNDKLAPSQWGMIASLLSMDSVGPFHEVMGLAWPDRSAFIKSLREMIVRNRNEYVGNPAVVPRLAGKLHALVEGLFGGEQADRFNRWAHGTFKQVHADQPEWSAWHVAFFRWVFGQKNNDLIAVTRVRPFVESRFRELADTEAIEKQFEKVKAQPLSDWDLEMCILRGFSPDSESGNFFDTVSATFEIQSTQVFIPELAAKLDDREKRWFTTEASRMIAEMKVWLPGSLPSLDEMCRRVP